MPAAQRVVQDLWRDRHRFAVLDRGPRRIDAKGRRTDGIETNRKRIEAFYTFRHRISTDLESGELTPNDARTCIARSEYDGQLEIATSFEEAVGLLAGLFVAGDNAIIDSESRRESVLLISAWRE